MLKRVEVGRFVFVSHVIRTVQCSVFAQPSISFQYLTTVQLFCLFASLKILLPPQSLPDQPEGGEGGGEEDDGESSEQADPAGARPSKLASQLRAEQLHLAGRGREEK